MSKRHSKPTRVSKDEANFGDFIEDKSAENPSDMTSYSLLKDKLDANLAEALGSQPAEGSAMGEELKLAGSLQIKDATGRKHSLELLVGDVTSATADAPVDLLAISAARNDYYPLPGTVIAALQERGVSLRRLADRRACDWRESWQCWISERVRPTTPRIARVLCFEHQGFGAPEELVGNIFRSTSEWLLRQGPGGAMLGTMRIPLLASGYQGRDAAAMLRAIAQQALLHLLGGLPVSKVQIVLRASSPRVLPLCVEFGTLIEEFKHSALHSSRGDSGRESDLFVSYRHSDLPTTNALLQSIHRVRSDLRIWIDREKLSAGCFWKPELLRAIGGARHGLCVVTDTYPDSPECMDEFHAALCCERSRRGYLLPILALSQRTVGSLPQSMRQVQFLATRNHQRGIGALADRIVNAVSSPRQ